MRISDWSSDVCSSDLFLCATSAPCRRNRSNVGNRSGGSCTHRGGGGAPFFIRTCGHFCPFRHYSDALHDPGDLFLPGRLDQAAQSDDQQRSEEHTSELKSLMRTSYAVFCLKKQKTT